MTSFYITFMHHNDNDKLNNHYWIPKEKKTNFPNTHKTHTESL